ncbi:MAG: DUF5330 domain-containing protein [Pseudolabrys sp.]|nr:DUF5330 domain-containing protein [Pseudolabrys sp.]
MFFLLRMGFWLGVVCVLLPSGTPSNTAQDGQIDAMQAVTVAGAAMSDMRGFCERQPDACDVGGKVAVALGHKAEAGARTLYEFISAKLAEKPAATEKAGARLVPVTTGGVGMPQASHGTLNGTLTAADMAPNWHGPVPLPPRREARAGRPSV